MTESGQVEKAARRAIARAKGRGAEEVTPDDLLVGALLEISRFGAAWIGERAIDVRRLSENGNRDDGDGATETAAPGGKDAAAPRAGPPAYSPDSVDLLERAAGLARADGAVNMGLVHLLAAFPDVECDLLADLLRDLGISASDWRAELARGTVGSPLRIAVDGVRDRERSGGGSSGGPEILSVDDAAEYLGVHAQTVRNYIRSGKLPAYRLAGERYIRVLRKDLLTLLERVETDVSD